MVQEQNTSQELKPELLSISIPSYNRAPILESLLAAFDRQMVQDQIDRKDVAFYLSDNGSPDETGSVFRTFAGKGYTAHYSRNETNIGIRKNVLKAFTLAKGEFIWVMGTTSC